MADIEIKPAAIAAQRAYDAADAEVARLVALQPSGVDVAAGEAEISDEQRAAVDEARRARLDALKALRAARAQITGDPIEVEQAVREAARA